MECCHGRVSLLQILCSKELKDKRPMMCIRKTLNGHGFYIGHLNELQEHQLYVRSSLEFQELDNQLIRGVTNKMEDFFYI